jgi:hypothetical protein
VRWRARPSGAEPTTFLGEVPRRYRRAVAVAIAVAGPLMAAYVLGYAATHPVRFDAQAQTTPPRVVAHEPGKVVRWSFQLEVVGSATVTDLEVFKSEGSPALQLERAGVLDYGWSRSVRMPLRPLTGLELDDGGHDGILTLELRHGRACPPPAGGLDAVWIRYTVLGMEHEQRVPLVDGPSVRCR